MLNRSTNCTLFMLLTFMLCSCGGNANLKPSATKTESPAAKNAQPLAKVSTAVGITPQELLSQAQFKKTPEREKLLLQAAQLYAKQGKQDKARNLLFTINEEKLLEPEFVRYCEITTQIDMSIGDTESARRILTNPRLERQLNALEPEQEANFREVRAQVFERAGQLTESVSERISLSAILTDKTLSNDNQDALWQTLLTIPLVDLQTNAAQGSGGITQGWYSLAALSKNNTQDIEDQQAELSKWLKKWSSHPANGNLPKDLRVLETLMKQQPQKIALLLPLQGRLAEAGEAVRDGFFAAYYQSINKTSITQTEGQHQFPNVTQYDASKGAVAAYQQAVAEGADLIIGPLDKEDVNQLGHIGNFSVPLLSLNYLPNDAQANVQQTQAIANFYQFGLAVEDEARQIARQAIQDGHQRALIVLPKQEVSERSAQAFIDEWQKLGGTIVGKSVFIDQDQFANALRNNLLIDESQTRMALLKQQLGVKFEFTPRRRDDVDMIFMAVTPGQGRQIKPTFAFHFANNIPMYATSAIYSGETDTANNEDLNGILFTAIPWLFDNNNPEKQAISQNTKSSAIYGRLHALGADAFHLYARLPQLKQAPQMRIYGATGSLHLSADGRIEREQVWARFHAGLAEQLATVVNDDENIQDE